MNGTTITVLPHPEKQRKDAGPLDYISASRLRTFQECRLKFYFRYVAKIPVPLAPALFVGQVVHTVLQQWNLARWRGEPADANALWPFFAEHWLQDQPADGIEWNGKEDAQKETAWGMLEHYLQNTPIPLQERPEAVEVIVERDLLAHGLPPLKGVIDLVREGGRIVDFKTTARTPDATLAVHQNEVQLGCYSLLYREAVGHQEGGLELHHLVKTKVPKLVVTNLEPMSADQIRRLVRVMESYVSGVEAEDFVPSPGLQCSYCDYLQECRAWKGGVLTLLVSVAADGAACLREAVRVTRPDGCLLVFDKFLPPDSSPSFRRRVFNLLTRTFGTNINRSFEPMISGLAVSVLKDEPVMFFGAYRAILLRKNS